MEKVFSSLVVRILIGGVLPLIPAVIVISTVTAISFKGEAEAAETLSEKCKKIESQIRLEEAIGLKYWKQLDAQRKNLPLDVKKTHLIAWLNSVNLILNSDIKALRLLIQNKNCFNDKTVKRNIELLNSTLNDKKDLIDIQKALNTYPNSYVFARKSETVRAMLEYYIEFWEIIDNKKIADGKIKSNQNTIEKGTRF